MSGTVRVPLTSLTRVSCITVDSTPPPVPFLPRPTGVPGRLDEAKAKVERKTATAVLLARSPERRGGWRMVTFGDRAEQEYIHARAGGEEAGGDLALFKYFKMELFKGGRRGRQRSSVDEAEGISEDTKTRLPLVYVVSLALEYIKDEIISKLNNSDNHTLSAQDVRWVLTVPAIWSSFGKTFMRTAAFRAGLIAQENDMEVGRRGRRGRTLLCFFKASRPFFISWVIIVHTELCIYVCLRGRLELLQLKQFPLRMEEQSETRTVPPPFTKKSFPLFLFPSPRKHSSFRILPSPCRPAAETPPLPGAGSRVPHCRGPPSKSPPV